VRGGIILRHQEQQLNTAIEEEINIATRRRSSEIRAHMLAKEASYKDIYLYTIPIYLKFDKDNILLPKLLANLYSYSSCDPLRWKTQPKGVPLRLQLHAGIRRRMCSQPC
jgi:hypothetical protein